MSGINYVNLPALSIASSVSGGQQARPGQDSAKAAAASQDFRSNLKAKASSAIEDVEQATLNTDRDADGLYLPDHPEDEQTQSPEKHGEEVKSQSHRSVDPDHILGTHLDLVA